MKEPGFAYTVMTEILLMFHITSLVQPRLNVSIHGSKVLETVKSRHATIIILFVYFSMWAEIAQFVALAMGWMVRGSNPGGGEIFHTFPDRPWDPPSLLYNGYWVSFWG
jgi:hypothetical protein